MSDVKETENMKAEKNVSARKRFILAAAISFSAALLLTVLAGACIIHKFSADNTVEIYDAPDYSYITKNPFISAVCSLETDTDSIDTSELSSVPINLRFFGFINKTATLNVVDSVPPEVSVKNVVTTYGSVITADMFIANVKDKTNVTVELKDGSDNAAVGEHKVQLKATDEGGNTSTYTANLTIIKPEKPLYFEYGVSTETLASELASAFGDNVEFDFPKQDDCAKITVTGKDKSSFYYVDIEINDIIAPVADVRSFDLVLGEKISETDIITNVFDHSEIKTTISPLPDFNKSGEHSVKIILTDEYGNASEYVSYIRIHDINTEIDVEINSHNEDIVDRIFNDSFSQKHLGFKKEYFVNFLGIKKTTIILTGKYNSINIKANVVDTKPPVLKVKYVEKLITKPLEPEEFVYICKDSTDVTYSFVGKPSTEEVGEFRVTIAATDACGNVTTADANLIVHGDTVPPEIHGAKDITTSLGKTPDYKSGVTVTDEISRYMDLNVDNSAVDINKLGVYPVIYTAIDQYGNSASQTVYLTVKESVRVRLDVENIKQYPRLPNGCEVVSLAIALKYSGYEIDPVLLFNKYMPTSSIMSNGDPWETYIGDPTDAGFGCYAPCLVTTGNDYLTDMKSPLKVEDVSGEDFSVYEGYINNGIPVIMWATTYMMDDDTVLRSWKSNGKEVVWHYYSHCLVMIGYTEDTYIFCDPLRGVVEYSRSAVERAFEINFKQACVIK